MIRSGCIGLGAGLVLSLVALGCGSSNSESGKGGNGGTAGPWDQARIGNSGVAWWMNIAKGKFFLSAKLSISYQDDLQGRAKTASIGKMMADKSGSSAESAVPKPDETPGAKWIIDPDQSLTAQGLAVATDKAKAEIFIDGGADPFYTSSYEAKTFVWANYLEDDASKGDHAFKLELIVCEMGSAADTKKLFTDTLSDSLYSQVTWKTCPGTDANNLCP